MLPAIAAISLGAALGAVLRWFLSLGLNQLLPQLPLGTLAANLLGGYLIGVAVGFFGQMPALAPEWRLFAITGFLGGLTTFSTFSAETVHALQQGRYGWAAAAITLHLGGSLAMTFAGLATIGLLRR
ncbi:MAG: fluoride efflux transporter CrcB [Burkholderiales bacterium]|nr:fluoride efflux transporter CrcB [Burkholderiales bacterium]MDE1929450.1 fluoride efflux transporter CrcB [Burkholderiales bacterium]MDE2160232.1 fluoride efflux transporter CrcB [Burkholderiales bacterium]MDE2501600.1 fluoride efflux transporter CrcB [Burkholderiales bacterium]